MLLPAAVLAVFGILMGLGGLLPGSFGSALYTAGSVGMDFGALIFAVMTAAALSGKKNVPVCVAAVLSCLVIAYLPATSLTEGLVGSARHGSLYTLSNPVLGVFAGLLAAACCKKLEKAPAAKILGPVVSTAVSLVIAGLLLLVWPLVISLDTSISQSLAGLGAFGTGLLALLGSFLTPLCLNIPLNASAVAPGAVFGVPATLMAMVLAVKPSRRKKLQLPLGLCAVCAMLFGITLPFAMTILFGAFPLFVVFCGLCGVFALLAALLGFQGGPGMVQALSGGTRVWALGIVGIVAAVVFFLAAAYIIKKQNLKTPGRTVSVPRAEKEEAPAAPNHSATAAALVAGLGGKANITALDHCVTRIKAEVKDPALVDDKKIKAAGVAGVIHPGKNNVHIIVGPRLQEFYEDFRKLAR